MGCTEAPQFLTPTHECHLRPRPLCGSQLGADVRNAERLRVPAACRTSAPAEAVRGSADQLIRLQAPRNATVRVGLTCSFPNASAVPSNVTLIALTAASGAWHMQSNHCRGGWYAIANSIWVSTARALKARRQRAAAPQLDTKAPRTFVTALAAAPTIPQAAQPAP